MAPETTGVSETLSLRAHAKLNLSLRVLAREESGYHAIETLLIRLRLADGIELATVAEPGVRLTVSGNPELPTDASNLCVRAAEAVAHELGLRGGIRLRLEKRIPVGAGLGGGSADAAAVLAGLQQLLGHPLSRDRLWQLAGELGSDVPFGLCETPMALAWERGRRLIPLDAPPPLPVVVAVPDFPISAGDAYGWLAADRAAGVARAPGSAGLPDASALRDLATLQRLAVNDLEGPVFDRYPRLRDIRDALNELGARIALLCGSGSCVAGVFADEGARDRAATKLGTWEDLSVLVTSTLR